MLPAQHTRSLALAAALLVAACTTRKPAPGAESAGVANDAAPVRPESLPRSEPSLVQQVPMLPVQGDTGEPAAIARLEREARAIAKTTGCGSASACRVAPVGARACGGPRDYIVYCAASTDTVALMRTLKELERVEKAYNAHSGMASSCQVMAAPSATLAGGSCREVTTGAGAERVP